MKTNWFLIGLSAIRFNAVGNCETACWVEVGQCASQQEAETLARLLAKERWPEADGWTYNVAARQLPPETLSELRGQTAATSEPVWPEDLAT